MRHKLKLAALLLAIAALPAVLISAGAIAQDQKNAEGPDKADERKAMLAERAKRAAAASEPLVGPLAPARARNLAQPHHAGNVRTPAPPPQPTVQLKPGEVPAIEFDTPEYDFGRVRAGSEIRHDFWFTNIGTGPLEILDAKAS